MSKITCYLTLAIGVVMGIAIFLSPIEMVVQLTKEENQRTPAQIMFVVSILGGNLLALYCWFWSMSMHSCSRGQQVVKIFVAAKELLAAKQCMWEKLKERSVKVSYGSSVAAKELLAAKQCMWEKLKERSVKQSNALQREVCRINVHVLFHTAVFVVPTLVYVLLSILRFFGLVDIPFHDLFGNKHLAWVKELQAVACTVAIYNSQALANILILVGRLAVLSFLQKVESLELYSKAERAEEVRTLRRQFQVLVDLVTGLNDTLYRIYMMFNIGYVLIAVLSLGCLIAAYADPGSLDESRFPVLLMSIISGTVLFLVSNISPILLNERLFKCTDALTNAWRRQQEMSYDCCINEKLDRIQGEQIDREFGYLLSTVVHTTIGITAGNFYYITRASCTTIFSAVVTYFVMILQLALTNPGDNHCVNATATTTMVPVAAP